MSTPIVTLDKDSDVPIWLQISEQIRQKVADGTLSPEEKLPPIRTLATSLDVNYQTVNKAYRFLCNMGYLASKQGSGVFVRRRTDDVQPGTAEEIGDMVREFMARCAKMGMYEDDVIMAIRAVSEYDRTAAEDPQVEVHFHVNETSAR